MKILNADLFEEARRKLQGLHSQVFFVHSDILKGFQIKLDKFSTEELLKSHISVIQQLTHPADLWFPVFNLSFPKTREYDVLKTPSEMGHLSEYFRSHIATWHNGIPMHGSCGTGESPASDTGTIADPWDAHSVFAKLIEKDGYLFFYGAGFDAISLLHYTEKQLTVPYRYEKIFEGTVKDRKGIESAIAVSHIVRPMQFDVNYHWQKLETDLKNAGLWMEISDKRTRLLALHTGSVFEFWKIKIQDDPFYLVDEQTKEWAVPMYEKLKRPFELTDFESID